MKRAFAVLLSVLAYTILALAQTSTWQLDKGHSSVTFNVKHMVISEVTGYFRDFAISLSAAKDDFTDAVIEGTIKVSSINSENERRDTHLKSDDFFNAEKFPEINFKSTSIEKVSERSYKIHGDLTIRDITKKVTFNAVHNGSLKTSRGTMSSWKATISVNRFDYGLRWDRTIETGGLVAGETVTITLNLEFLKPNA